MSIGFFFLSAVTFESKDSEAAPQEIGRQSADQGGAVISNYHDQTPGNDLEVGSAGRKLSQYYNRRQYLGSPPEIPHPVEVHGKTLDCLICHRNGGWTGILKRMTPVTPHPEQVSCMQCHLHPVTEDLFRANDWQSLSPPRLGWSYLPGAPPPITHDLHMRDNCDACHVGPGTVAAIRMKHEWRANCRQCHVSAPPVEPFRR
jgi:nitrate reductase cytochrome c-type subunit